MFDAKVVLHSVGPAGIPLISVAATYPRFIHAEFMTHRDRARNAASSRAIPWKRQSKVACTMQEMPKGAIPIGIGEFSEIGLDPAARYHYYIPKCMYSMVMSDPVVPIEFGREQSGMQSGAALEGVELREAMTTWMEARNSAVGYADRLAKLGVHKSLCNRLTEPFMWITVLYTSTEWRNFFRLRCHPKAEVHFQLIAGMMREAISKSVPQVLGAGEWHLPYLTDEERETLKTVSGRDWCASKTMPIMYYPTDFMTEDELWERTRIEYWKRVSSGRCARLSYLTHEGVRDTSEDVRLCGDLIKPPGDELEEVMHASPLEHVAEAGSDGSIRSGPFRGWKQFRKEFVNENVIG